MANASPRTDICPCSTPMASSQSSFDDAPFMGVPYTASWLPLQHGRRRPKRSRRGIRFLRPKQQHLVSHRPSTSFTTWKLVSNARGRHARSPKSWFVKEMSRRIIFCVTAPMGFSMTHGFPVCCSSRRTAGINCSSLDSVSPPPQCAMADVA